MIRVVLDTNILISAILSPSGPVAQILRLAREGRIELVFSPDTATEHLKVMRDPQIRRLLEKRRLPLSVAERFLKHLAQASLLVMGKTKVDAIKDDPSDNIFLSCAIDGKADFIVSGDRHLKELREFQGIRIVDPATFIALFERR